MKPAVSIDLSDLPLHCPKCGMQFARKPWPHMGQWGAQAERGPCGECGVTMIAGEQKEFDAAGRVIARSLRAMVASVDEARSCWGLA